MSLRLIRTNRLRSVVTVAARTLLIHASAESRRQSRSSAQQGRRDRTGNRCRSAMSRLTAHSVGAVPLLVRLIQVSLLIQSTLRRSRLRRRRRSSLSLLNLTSRLFVSLRTSQNGRNDLAQLLHRNCALTNHHVGEGSAIQNRRRCRVTLSHHNHAVLIRLRLKRLRTSTTINHHGNVLAQGIHGGLCVQSGFLTGLVRARNRQRTVLSQQLQGELVIGNTHSNSTAGLTQIPAQRRVRVKNKSQRAGPEATTQIVNIVRNVVDHASERSKIKDQYGRRHGAVAALICQQLGNALMRESIGGNTVDGIGGHHNRVVRLQRLAGSLDGLAGLSFSRYGVQLCSHGSYSLMFFWMRRDTGTHNAPCGSTLPGVHHILPDLSGLRRRTRCLHAARHRLGGASTSLKALVGAVYNRRYDADDYSGHAPGSSPRSRCAPAVRRRLLPGYRRAP